LVGLGWEFPEFSVKNKDLKRSTDCLKNKMEFCPKCGAILEKKLKRYGCPKCNYTSKNKVKVEATEKMKEKGKIDVVKEKDTDVMPTTTATCSKCGNEEAYFWSAQTRAADEAETQFFKCTKCEHTWRIYD